jgi:hypothetical protein
MLDISSNNATLFAGFGGAVLGAIASGAVTIALKAYEKLESEKVALTKLSFELIKMHSYLNALDKNFKSQILAANAQGLYSAPLWSKILPSPSPIDAIAFESEMLAPLVNAKEFEFVRRLLDASGAYGSIRESYFAYSERRSNLSNELSVAGTSGKVLYSGLTDEQYTKFAPSRIQLESLLEHLMPTLATTLEEVEQLVVRIGPISNSYLGNRSVPSYKLREDSKNGK